MTQHKNYKINFRHISIIILLVIIASAFQIRFSNLSLHFSHFDDLIAPTVATTYADSILEETIKNVEFSKSQEASLRIVYPYFKPLITAFGVAKQSTYAPLQFVLTGAIVNNQMSYYEILFHSRLVTLIFAIFSLFSILLIYRILHGKDYLLYSILGTSILGFSWAHLVYSMQSENYTIGLFTVLLSFAILNYCLNQTQLNKKQSILLGIVLSLFILSSYQFLFFIPGFYIALYILNKHNYKSFFSSYKLSILVVTSSTLLVNELFLSHLLTRGVNWNAGPNNEFLFSLAKDNGFIENIKYVIHYFTHNIYSVFRHLTSITTPGSITNDIFALISIILFTIGIYSFYKSKDKIKKCLLYYFFGTSFIWLILILIKKITLSPTRHSIVLFSFILIFLPAGLAYIAETLKLNGKALVLIYSASILIIFSYNYSMLMSKRIDKFNPLEIEKLIKKHDVSEIFEYEWTNNLDFMTYIKNNFDIKRKSVSETYFKSKKNLSNKKALFITHRSIAFTKKIQNRFLKFSKYPQNTSLKIIYKKEIPSNTEICFGNETKNGTNSLFMYIVQIGAI